jgi:hypothetical protein
MAFHLAGYSAAVDQAAIAPIAAIADPSLSVAGNNIQIPDFAPYLMGAYGLGINLTRAQLQSPSLRRVVNPELRPLDVLALPSTYPPFIDLMHNPIPLDIAEQMQAFTAEDGAGATRMNVLAWLGDGKVDVITDPIFSVRLTGATTLVAFTWTNGAMVFDQVLPVGDFAIVGAKVTSTTLIAFRFVFQGSTPRPGGIGSATAALVEAKGQRYGGWGIWGYFHSTTPPTIDYLASAADAAEVITLDLIKVG